MSDSEPEMKRCHVTDGRRGVGNGKVDSYLKTLVNPGVKPSICIGGYISCREKCRNITCPTHPTTPCFVGTTPNSKLDSSLQLIYSSAINTCKISWRHFTTQLKPATHWNFTSIGIGVSKYLPCMHSGLERWRKLCSDCKVSEGVGYGRRKVKVEMSSWSH